MERTIRVEAFRNIGFKDIVNSKDKDKKYERLVLNNSINKGELGDLIILIGTNNSGKSNVLDAINTLSNNKITEDDKTYLYMEDDRVPEVTLFYRRDQDRKDWYSYKKSLNRKDEMVSLENIKVPFRFHHSNENNLLEDLRVIASIENDNYNYWDGINIRPIFDRVFNSNDLDDECFCMDMNFEDAAYKTFEIFEEYNEEYRKSFSDDEYQSVINTRIYKDYILFKNCKDAAYNIINSFKDICGYNFIPNIIKYENEEISNEDLKVHPQELSNNLFFRALLQCLDVDIEFINTGYDKSKKIGKAALKQLESKLNEKLEIVSGKFNKLYYVDEQKYSFEVDLENESIELMIFREKQALSLKHQSTGFKWFFNLFFNLLNSNDINAGDIIIMDEPSTNVHVKGQKELRTFLKDFAIQNDIIIIIATHSPFLIDLDNLDELRIILNQENITSIVNNFSAIDLEIPDTLLPIRETLTVENHILVNPKKNVVFVEGITDYIYLTAFKNLLNKDDFVFLPINGIGKSDEERQRISEQLLRLRENPIVLVDGDSAGKKLLELNEENKSDLHVITLNEIDTKFKEIESLFMPEDIKKFNLADKHASNAIVLKNKLIYEKDEVSERTKQNFEKLFKTLEETS